MTILLYISLYASIACFVFGCARRVRQYATLPVHLRWELYPVPHEPAERAKHGGSYFEQSDWWTKPRHANRLGELRVMLAEILLFKSIWKSSRTLWWRSLLFHAGMYCMVAAIALQVFAGIGFAGSQMKQVAGGLAVAGLCLTTIGAMALLWRRLMAAELRDYTHVADFIHLGAIALAGALLFTGSLDPRAPSGAELLRSAMTFDLGLRVPPLLASGMFLALAMFAYVPFSHMAHFIAKYFTYHSIRWDDEPSRGGAFTGGMAKNLGHRPTWSASHIKGDGSKTWTEIALENPTTPDGVRR